MGTLTWIIYIYIYIYIYVCVCVFLYIKQKYKYVNILTHIHIYMNKYVVVPPIKFLHQCILNDRGLNKVFFRAFPFPNLYVWLPGTGEVDERIWRWPGSALGCCADDDKSVISPLVINKTKIIWCNLKSYMMMVLEENWEDKMFRKSN